MKYNPVGWFEIPALDMQRAKTFYEAVFQRKLSDLDMPGMEMAVWDMDQSATGSSGALVKMDGLRPSASPGLMVYFSCEDLEIELGRVVDAGGEVIMPKTSIGEHGFVASFLDSEGNLISLHTGA